MSVLQNKLKVTYCVKSYFLRKPKWSKWSKTGSAESFHKSIIDRLGGLMDKYTKVCSSSVLV